MAAESSSMVLDVAGSSAQTSQQWAAVANPKLVEMWRNERGCDVSIICKNNDVLKAHSLVLCSVSDKLDELLNTTTGGDKVISSPDVEYCTWKTLLEIIYTGSLDVNSGEIELGSLEVAILLAETLGMNGVVQLYNSSSIVQLMKESDIVLASNGEVSYAGTVTSDDMLDSEHVSRAPATLATDMLGTVVSFGMSDINDSNQIGQVPVESAPNAQVVDFEDGNQGNQVIMLSTGQKDQLNHSQVMEIISYGNIDDGRTFNPMIKEGNSSLVNPNMPLVGDITMTDSPSQSSNAQSVPKVFALGQVQNKDHKLRVPRKKVCYGCKRSECTADQVKCILCCKVVNNNNTHMELVHHNSPKTSSWVFTCKFFGKPTRDWLVCKKGHVKIINHVGTPVAKEQHQCLLCDKIHFETLNEVINHLKSKHLISVRLCKICHFGFSSSLQYKDHEHFCNGGDLIKCRHCKKVVGGFHALNSHMSVHRNDLLEDEQEPIEGNEDVEFNDEDVAKLEQDIENIPKIKQTRPKNIHRKEVCTRCGNSCKAKKVRCLYCFQVVPRNSLHMKEEHVFTPPESLWVYNCKHLPSDNVEASSVICVKIQSTNDEQNNSNAEPNSEIPSNRCLKCQKLFPTSEAVEKHLRLEHNILVRMCTTCGMGLIKEYQFKDHQHFCKGGKILYCKTCFRKVGGLKALKDHMYRLHNQGVGGKDDQENMGLTEDDFDNNAMPEDSSDEISAHHCKACDEFFSSRKQLCEHNRVLHENDTTSALKIRKKKVPVKPVVYSTRSGRRISKGNPRFSDYVTDIDIKKEEESESNDEIEDTVSPPDSLKISESHVIFNHESNEERGISLYTQCIQCENDSCEASSVKCLYCFNIVQNDVTHVKDVHPYLTHNGVWIIDCGVNTGDDLRVQKMICSKEAVGDKNLSGRASQYQYKCMICEETSLTSEDLQDHIQLEHAIDAKLCILCGAGFIHDKYHMVHEHFCMGRDVREPIKCSNCYYEIELKTIEEHVCIEGRNTDHADETLLEIAHYCDKCCIEFETFRHLQLHKATEHKKEDTTKENRKITPVRKSPVKNCKKRRNVTDNIDTSKGVCIECNGQCSEEKVRCQYCFKIVENDASHKKICHPFSPKDSIWAFTCKLELRKYQSIMPIIFAKEIYHNKVEETEEEQAQAEKLNLHQFKCLRCESKFSTIEELQQHVKVKYRCYKCKLYFVKLNSLVRHVQRNHGYDVKVCKECECGFANENCREEHEHFCQGGGALECRVCGSDFFSVGKLKIHMELEHARGKSPGSRPPIQDDNAVDNMEDKEPPVIISRPKKPRLEIKEPSELEEPDPPQDVNIILENEENLSVNTEAINQTPDNELEELEKFDEQADAGAMDDDLADPSYNAEDDEVGKDEPIDDGDDNDESDYDSPEIMNTIKEEPPVKKGRGRPKKMHGGIVVKPKKPVKLHPPTEEELNILHSENFTKIESQREWVHCKVCYTCGINCDADTVKCGYCGMVLSVADKFNHMQDMHPLTPPTSLWPVNCRFFKLNIQIPEVVAKQVVEFEVVKDEDENMIQYSKGQGVYVCNICEVNCGDLDATDRHLIDTHNVKVLFCEQCGLGIKSSCLNLMSDHQHFCLGGHMLQCFRCPKKVGCWKSADSHQKKSHGADSSLKKKRTCNKPLYKSDTTITEGMYGYTIMCGDCNGTCKNSPVKCGLCHEIVEKNDLHMKLKHPYSPCTTWVVCCRFALHAGSMGSSQLPEYIGEKVATVSQTDLLQEGTIPSNHPFHYKCNHCQMYFLERKYLKLHIKSAHVDLIKPDHLKQMTFCCKFCDAILYGRSYFFQDHAQFCGKGELHPCSVCGETFIGLQKLNMHKKTQHNEMYSDRMKAKKSSVRVHNHVVEIPDGTVLQCVECQYNTTVIKNIKHHNKTVHGWKGLQLIQFCRFCYRIFKVRSDRERHEQIEHLNGAKSLCETCGESFDIPIQLERHEYYAHRGGREYIAVKQRQERENATIKICPHCTKEYTSQGKLNRHIKVVHEQSLVFQCTSCHKTFNSKSSLKVHMDRHTGNRTCKCPYCPYTDYQGYMINNHVQLEHPGKEKPYKRKMVFGEDVKKEDNEAEEEVIYEIADPETTIFQVPTQQIEVKQVEMVSQGVENAVAAGNVLLEYYVVQ